MPQDIKDIYEICMNKDPKTRPTAEELLGLEVIQQWAKELGIMSQ